MPPQYSYPSNVRRHGLPHNRGRLQNYTGPTMTGKEMEEIAEEQRTREARISWRDKRFSEGHITRTLRYVAYMRFPRWHWRRSRLRRQHNLRLRVPKTVLDTIARFNLE